MSTTFNKEKVNSEFPEAGDFMIEPMKIHGSTPDKIKEICAGNDYFAEVKKDGAFYMYVKTENHSYLFSRNVSVTNGLLNEKSANVPHIMEVLDTFAPEGTMIIGEVYYPGGTSKDTVKVMGSLPDRAVEIQNSTEYELGKIHFYMHDILWYNGENFVSEGISNYGRYVILKNWNNSHKISDTYDFIEMAEIYEPSEINLYTKLAQVLASGEEGLVFKAYTGKYEPGKRPMTNWKAKQVDTTDAIIIGFEPTTKEYKGKELESWPYFEDDGKGNKIPVTKAYFMGWNNSVIRVGMYTGNVNDDGSGGYIREIGTVSSGISDEMKEDMTKNPVNYLNKVCELQCMSKDCEAGTLRHPFFLRMRNDKDAKDCLFDENFKKT